ncbi:MAG TPA: hypothetical protein VGJ28_18535 [Micromonosporaceae bacterium]|jgi:hypothetical protein
MTTWQIFAGGFDPDHLPALYAGILYALVAAAISLGRRSRSSVPIADRLAGHLLGDSAAIHLALPIGHHDDPVLVVLFLASGVVYGVLGWRAVVGGRYRAASAVLLVATLIAYIDVVGTGGEGADQVGILTAVVEVVTLGICLVPRAHAPVRRTFGSIAFVLAVTLTGAGIWIASYAHAADSSSTLTAAAGHHDADRGEAGMIMAPVADAAASPAQTRAAALLADRTAASLQRFTDIRAALAAGYRPTLTSTGLRVHLENKAFTKDGRILDPQRPEDLMYAIADGKATLLSAVYEMPYANDPGPTPGGPITMWHTHDVCVTALPPSYTVVDAYGDCPMLSVALTVGQMMHVWVVAHPGGPYNDDVPDAWISAYNESHGIPYQP